MDDMEILTQSPAQYGFLGVVIAGVAWIVRTLTRRLKEKDEDIRKLYKENKEDREKYFSELNKVIDDYNRSYQLFREDMKALSDTINMMYKEHNKRRK